MDKIHDKANKIFTDVRKKKINIGKSIRKSDKEEAKETSCHISNLSCNCCSYCQKVFIDSKFLMKHIIRRHSDDLILLHKKCLKHESNNNSGNLQSLISYLESEFVALRNELVIVKRRIADRNADIEIPNENKSEIEEDPVISKNIDYNIATDTNSNELKILNENIFDLEKNIQSLHNKYEELDNVLKNEITSKEDITNQMAQNEEKILRAQEHQFIELRRILLNDLQSMLSNQLHEINNEWLSRLLELRQEIKKHDCIIDTINKQINSPDLLRNFERKIERQVTYFVGNTKHNDRKTKNSRCRIKLPEAKIPCLSQEKKSKIKKPSTTNITKSKEDSEASLVPSELSFILSEKLSQFNIVPNVSKMTDAEFDEKLKLINFEKEHLIKKYPNFCEIYDKINSYADHAVSRKLNNKKCRKIRFSEPVTSNKKVSSSSLRSNKDYMHEISPILLKENNQFTGFPNQKLSDIEHEDFISPEESVFVTKNEKPDDNETFTNTGGSGDYFQNYRQDVTVRHVKPNFIKEMKTSSPILDIHASKKADIFLQDCSHLNPVSSISDKISDGESSKIIKKSDCTFIKYPKQNERALHFKSSKKFVNAEYNDHKNENLCDDESSLQSLSSWEDNASES